MKIRGILFCAAILVGLAGSSMAQQVCTGAQLFTAPACAGDGSSAEERTLFDLVNKYRAANGRPAVPLSAPLSKLGNRRMLDLRQNMKRMTHSWSNCPYDIANEKTWPCLIDSPKRLNSGYNGEGYETLYFTSNRSVSPAAALEAWKNSSLHSSIILNQGMFKDMPWEEVGIAIDGQYAALWFGFRASNAKAASGSVTGLGVSYDQAVSGLTRLLSINPAAPSAGGSRWEGFSADRKIKLEITGTRQEISQAEVALTVRLDPDGTIAPDKKLVLSKLLKNCFPEWTDVDVWLNSSINTIAQNSSAWRTRVVRRITIDMRSEGANSLKLSIKPQSSKPQSIEIT